MTVATKLTSPINVDHRAGLDIRSGDTVRVWTKVVEKGKTRLQAFEGLVLARKHGSEPGATFTVRKVSDGVGVERIFPLYSPNIEKVELVKRAKTRRAKLYYIRQKAAKEIRRKMKAIAGEMPSFAEIASEDKQDFEEEQPTTDNSQPTTDNEQHGTNTRMSANDTNVDGEANEAEANEAANEANEVNEANEAPHQPVQDEANEREAETEKDK